MSQVIHHGKEVVSQCQQCPAVPAYSNLADTSETQVHPCAALRGLSRGLQGRIQPNSHTSDIKTRPSDPTMREKVKWWYGPHRLISQSGLLLRGGFEETYIHGSSVVSSPRCLEQPTSWFPSKPCANVPRIFVVILRFHIEIYFMDIILPSH